MKTSSTYSDIKSVVTKLALQLFLNIFKPVDKDNIESAFYIIWFCLFEPVSGALKPTFAVLYAYGLK